MAKYLFELVYSGFASQLYSCLWAKIQLETMAVNFFINIKLQTELTLK